jgi:hypothetical protein
MNGNLESPSSGAISPKARAARSLLRFGVTCLVLAALCAAVTYAMTLRGMLVSFDAVSKTGTPPAPDQVASDIAIAMIPACAVVPLGLLGMVLLIPGLVLRRQVTKQGK